jgi:hypothetical protein
VLLLPTLLLCAEAVLATTRRCRWRRAAGLHAAPPDCAGRATDGALVGSSRCIEALCGREMRWQAFSSNTGRVPSQGPRCYRRSQRLQSLNNHKAQWGNGWFGSPAQHGPSGRAPPPLTVRPVLSLMLCFTHSQTSLVYKCQACY